MILHGYFRSGTSYRTRIALHLKGLDYETRPVDLRTGDQGTDAYRGLSPQGLVPALETADGVLFQSPAILEWLEERFPEPPLLPESPADRAVARAMAAIVGCDIHPLNNLRVLKTLRQDFGADDAMTDAWAARWILPGLDALDKMVARHGRGWCFGDQPGLVDCYLIPQLYSARRFHVPLDGFVHLAEIDGRAQGHPAFRAAHPDRQPDAG